MGWAYAAGDEMYAGIAAVANAAAKGEALPEGNPFAIPEAMEKMGRMDLPGFRKLRP